MGLVIGIIVVVVLVLLAIFVIAGYNGLVRARNAYKNAFAQIDVQLRRRFDLIPNRSRPQMPTWRTSARPCRPLSLRAARQ